MICNLVREYTNDANHEHGLPNAGVTFDPEKLARRIRLVNSRTDEGGILWSIKNPVEYVVQQTSLLSLDSIYIVYWVQHENILQVLSAFLILIKIFLKSNQILKSMMYVLMHGPQL